MPELSASCCCFWKYSLSWMVLRDQFKLSSGGAEFVFFCSIQFITRSRAEAGQGNDARECEKGLAGALFHRSWPGLLSIVPLDPPLLGAGLLRPVLHLGQGPDGFHVLAGDADR